MSKDFPNRQSIRLRGYDYTQNGYYFVTICTHNRENLFGEIVGARRDAPIGSPGSTPIGSPGGAPDFKKTPVQNKKPFMKLNENGKIVTAVWQSLPKHHSIRLGKFQIMPNHVHLVLELTGDHKNGSDGLEIGSGGPRPAPTLGMIIGFLKSESTKQIRRSVGVGRDRPERGSPDTTCDRPECVSFVTSIWQRNYYERIIRDENEYDQICFYITHNPEIWDRDRNNLAKIGESDVPI